LQALIGQVFVEGVRCSVTILRIATATRTEAEFKAGVSVRGGLALRTAAQARALVLGGFCAAGRRERAGGADVDAPAGAGAADQRCAGRAPRGGGDSETDRRERGVADLVDGVVPCL